MKHTSLEFHDMGLEDRLLKSMAKLKWLKPTLVQEKAIPLALDGKDLLLRARTGSGKTAACVVPIVHQILQLKKNLQKQSDYAQQVSAMIVVPSCELSKQVHTVMQQLTSACFQDVSCVDTAVQGDIELLRPSLSMKPDVVVGTPSRLLAHIRADTLSLSAPLKWLVIDEADLLFTFGYEQEMRTLLSHCHNSYQAFLMSATFTEDVDTLKKLVLHNPVTLNLTEGSSPISGKLSQYHVACSGDDDKFFLIYTLIKLQLLKGKSLIFVNSINHSYKLKLFLEQFSIRCCVLNSELPTNSRYHVVEQFNKGIYKHVIATEQSSDLLFDAREEATEEKKSRKRKRKAKNYSTSRGVDFQKLSNVINFDFPADVTSYIHRVGRTARVDSKGTALSFVTSNDESVLAEVQEAMGEENPLKPFDINLEELEGFRYRCEDALGHVTANTVKMARLRELRSEMLRSKQLKNYFDSNPRDLALLRHDSVLHPAAVQPQLKDVPEYLVPESMKKTFKPPEEPAAKRRKRHRKQLGDRKSKKRRGDPLRSFKYHAKSR